MPFTQLRASGGRPGIDLGHRGQGERPGLRPGQQPPSRQFDERPRCDERVVVQPLGKGVLPAPFDRREQQGERRAFVNAVAHFEQYHVQDEFRVHRAFGRCGRCLVAVVTVSAGTAMPAAADTDLPEYLTKMRAPQMWKVADGTGITVAVIDSGVKDLPELEGRVLPGVSFMEPPVSRPEEKYPVHDDFEGHGTSMIAAIVGDGSGGGPHGLAPGAKVMPIRTSIGSPMAFGAIGEAGKGVRYAADNGAKIINLSIGGWWSLDRIGPAIEYAQSKGVLVFVGMGNDGSKMSNPIAALPGAFGVGAVDIDGEPLPSSSDGPATDFAAFGGKVPIRCKKNTAWCMQDGGTSYATSIASASAALVWSAHPDWTANQVTRVLLQTVGTPPFRRQAQ